MSEWCVEVSGTSHKTFPLKILESIFDTMKSNPSQVTHSINQSFFLNKFHQIDDFQKKAFQNIDHSFSIQFTEKSEFVFYSIEHHESKLNSMKNRAKAPTNKSLSIFSFKFSPISFFFSKFISNNKTTSWLHRVYKFFCDFWIGNAGKWGDCGGFSVL